MKCNVEEHSNYENKEMRICSECGETNCPDCLSYDSTHCYHCGENF